MGLLDYVSELMIHDLVTLSIERKKIQDRYLHPRRLCNRPLTFSDTDALSLSHKAPEEQY